jgi:hypothetical protein
MAEFSAKQLKTDQTNFEAVKLQNLTKSGRKEAGKYFRSYLEEKHIIVCIF